MEKLSEFYTLLKNIFALEIHSNINGLFIKENSIRYLGIEIYKEPEGEIVIERMKIGYAQDINEVDNLFIFLGEDEIKKRLIIFDYSNIYYIDNEFKHFENLINMFFDLLKPVLEYYKMEIEKF